ncbi:MAG: ferrous iron transporter B [bacterium]
MKRIVLIGNPNVGKSVVFSRLTGTHVISSNYPGTTVEFTEGFAKIADEQAIIIDSPGAYSMNPTCRAEEVVIEILKDADLVINVIDSTNLERNLYLTLQILQTDMPVVVALNMWDETKHKGITIDFEKLEELLHVPVIPVVAITGQGMNNLVEKIPEAVSPKVKRSKKPDHWKDIGAIIEQVQILEHRHHTFLERMEELSIHPLTGFPIAAAVVLIAFKLIRFIGEGLISYLFAPFFDHLYAPVIMKFSELLGSKGILHDILIGKFIDGSIDFVQSFGVLTTGLFVPIAMVLPYVFSFFLVLSFLEDIGYLPRLAILVDNLMHRIGLHGYAIIPMILGLGCNVPGIMATRILESKREKFIAITLLSIGVPCAALQAMVFGLVGKQGGQYVAMVFGTLFIVWLLLGYIMNKLVKGFSPPLLIEVPPYRLPLWNVCLKKFRMRLFYFLKEAIPIVLAGVFVVNILYTLRIFDFLADIAAPVITGLLGLPKEVVVAIVIGFLRKDVAVGMLAPFNLTAQQLVVSSTVLAMFFPCIATFMIVIKELGVKDAVKSILIMIFVSLFVGSVLNFIFKLAG